MGFSFTLRFLLGTVLVLSCAWSIQTTQIDEETKNEQVEESTKDVVANLGENSNHEPKTDISTESNKTVDSSEVNKKEEVGRLLDIEKYISQEFHNKNNVYTLPTSPDTQKYIDPEYEFHATTHKQHDHSEEFDFDTELTTPKSLIFDDKYKKAVESVDENLGHIDDSQSHELSLESESKENINLEKLYEQTKKNDTTADLDYVNYKNIIANDTGSKNSVHKDVVVEAGTNLAFLSSYNHTTIIDENDSGNNNTIIKEPESEEKVDSSTISNLIPVKGDLEKTESVTIKTPQLTTRKNIVLTKPPSNRNSSHISILSNNIETETVKAKQAITTEKPKGEKEGVVETYTKRSPIDITKRGSIKFSDTITTEPSFSANKITKKPEQLLQENQIIPIHVELPLNDSIESTTIKTETVTTTIVKPTSAPISTIYTTTEVKSASTTELERETTSPDSVTVLPIELEVTTQSQFKTVLTSTQSEPQADESTTSLTATSIETTTAATTPLETTTDTIWLAPLTTEQELQEATTFVSTYLSDSTVTTSEETTTATTTEYITSTTTEDASTTQTPTVNGSNDEIRNITITVVTTESVRTSKKMQLKESTTATETIVTVTPETTSTESPTTATESLNVETETEQARVEQETTAFVFPVSRVPVPEFKHASPNDSTTETETTENNTITSDSYELTTNSPEDNSGTIAAITISSIGAVCLVLLAGLLVMMRKRQKRFNYGQRCRPVNLDDYSMDNVSVYNSVRRKGMMRGSKRSYGNPAFEDPALVSHTLNFPALGKFASNLEDMKAEFEEIPQITARTNELPEGCDTKNRYANVIPLPETRVFLSVIDGYPNSDYINANYVTGPKNIKGYYIACQAPMLNTVDDFWRMVWEQQSKVILMLTHLFENGVEKCVDYLPPSEVLDCHRLFGDFQITLKKREVKDKYIISILQLKNMVSNSWREITHFWYLGWPEKGVPSEANSLIAFLIEARSYMKSSSLDRKEVTNGNLSNGATKNELNPVVVHCSPGTGRTGVVIACDIAIREFEQTRLVDIPRIVYKIRRDRASAVQTREQYAFIYKVVNLYATKLTGGALDSL